VPPDVGIDVKGWLAASCGPLGGKGGGGKGGLAQGQGPNVDAVPDAVAAAEAFAKLAI
jgi:alanyl-tRNA synthetase